jgi:response regulator RpfG family c-di-GMP phosphodiesterase
MFSKNRSSGAAQKNSLTSSENNTVAQPTWLMLIVDDEPDIHKITEIALSGVTFEGRGLRFLNAYSGAEAKTLLAAHDDIALVILDVVMETSQAGLDVARFIREELKNKLTRIVLRTGQPGEAPEEKVFVEYDINDYKEKTDLDRKRLFTTVYSAIRAYRDLISIEESRKYLDKNRAGLEKVIHASARLFESRSLNEFATGMLEQIASVLFIEADTLLIHAIGASAVNGNNHDFQVVSKSGRFIDADPDELKKAEAYLHEACNQKKSLFMDDSFVGFFQTKSGRATLIYIEGVGQLDELRKKLLDIFSINITIAFENINLERELNQTQTEIILRLGEVLETRSRETGNHVRRLALLSAMLARKLGLTEEECIEIQNASPMHDIGKVAIPDSILLKPGRLTVEEFEEMKFHAEAGYIMLKGSKRSFMNSAAIIAWQHHERFDGKGYPRGLKGDEIHIYAKIVAVIDVFDALMHKRCYKKPWTLEQTLEALKEGRGKQFDAKVIDAFLDVIPEALEIIKKHPDKAEAE